MLSSLAALKPPLQRIATMKTETLKGTIESAFGVKLPSALEYNGSFEAYENVSEVRAANDMPSDDEVVSFRNTQRRNNKRQALMTDALEVAAKAWTGTGTNPYVKPTLETSSDLRFKVIYDALIAAGKSEEEAKATATAALS
jgi:hypothetical protein